MLLDSGGGINQQAGNITAAAMRVNAAGNVDMTTGSNHVDTIAAAVTPSGDFRYRDTGSVTIGTVGGVNGIDTAGAVWVRTGANLTLAQGVTANAVGDQALVLAATRHFTNQDGAAALTAPNGRWLVYDDNPLLTDRFDGMSFDFRRLRTLYDNYPPGSVAERGNGYITTAVLLDPDQAVRQPGGATVGARAPANTTLATALVAEQSAMAADGVVSALLVGNDPLANLAFGPAPLSGMEGAGMGAALLPVLPLRVALSPGERFSVSLSDLITGGRLTSSTLVDGSPMPPWLLLDTTIGALLGVIPEGVDSLPTIRVSVQMRDGSRGFFILNLNRVSK
ncbi:MAG: hypothetical protein LRY72_17040 [Saccharospirillaceae bacterium]|nr:hypothetical protein [Saccharospirillaceae bacterium]